MPVLYEGFSGTRSRPVTAAVAGFCSAPWPEFGPPYTLRVVRASWFEGQKANCRVDHYFAAYGEADQHLVHT